MGLEAVAPFPLETTVSTTPAGNGGTGGETVPAPSLLEQLTGCSNPNTGAPRGDWGVGSDPVYAPIGNTTPTLGSPVYTANDIFWTSRENAPGQSVLLAGAFTDAVKTVRVVSIPPGTTDWQAMVRASDTVVPTIQQGVTGLSFKIPSSFSPGVVGFEIEDLTAAPVLGMANVPLLNWAVGIPSTHGPSSALEHQVRDCAVEQGGVLRLFGKNFLTTSKVVLQASNGVAYSFTPSKIDTNSASVYIPSDFAVGPYNVWIGDSPWSATSSPAAPISVYSKAPMYAQNVNCTQLVGDGVTDNVAALQACLDTYAPAAALKDLVVHIMIPAGTFVLTSGITMHPYEVLAGASPVATKFLGRPSGPPPTTWFDLPQYSGLANLSLRAPANPHLLLTSGTLTGDPNSSGHLYFSNIDFASTKDASQGGELMFSIAGPDIQVYNSTFRSGSNQVFDIYFGDGVIVSGNQFVLNNWTGLSIGDSQNVIFERNLTYSEQPPERQANGHQAGSGLSIGRANAQWGASALSRDLYVGYNNFTHMGSNDQQVITNDGDGGAYLGGVAASTAARVILAADPAWNWMGTTNPQAAVMAIISGTGVGQYSFLRSYSGRIINLQTPWKVAPDETSLVVITQYEQNMTISHNLIADTLGGSIVLGDALDGVISDNLLINSGQGILISAFGPYGGPAAYGPVMNTDVLRNTLSPGAGNLIAHDDGLYLWGIGIQDFPGCLLSGLMIRGNIVPSVQTIYSTDGVNGISANVVEQNQATWAHSFPTAGFLIQDYSPPPH
jgi:hypothetical protein